MTEQELVKQWLQPGAIVPVDANTTRILITALRERLAQPEQEPVAWVYPEGLEALKSGRPWTAYGSSGEGRIPLYLNDAVAQRVEPPAAESGAGFESLPASPKWQGLTHDEITKAGHLNVEGERMLPYSFARAIEAKLKEKNT